jgi:hypothetical protein
VQQFVYRKLPIDTL